MFKNIVLGLLAFGLFGCVGFSTLTIRGRLVDRFTGEPISKVGIRLGEARSGNMAQSVHTYTDSGGVFTINTLRLPPVDSEKIFMYTPPCHRPQHFALHTDFQDNATVRVDLFDFPLKTKVVPVETADVNLGNIHLWPAVELQIKSEVPVQLSIEYSEGRQFVRHDDYRNNHTALFAIPLNYEVRVKLIDKKGNVYHAPYIRFGTERGCRAATLSFINGSFRLE